MAQFVVRDLEEGVKTRLKRLAKRHGRSMEAEVRHILRDATKGLGLAEMKLGQRIAARFASVGLESELPELRGQIVQPVEYKP
jgi:plasmid stability protein